MRSHRFTHGYVPVIRERIGNNPRVTIEHSTFEAYETDVQFDAIFSATAFHWPDPELKYRKAEKLLKDDGILALYWNNYSIADDELLDEIQTVYHRHHPHGQKIADVRGEQKRKISRRQEEVAASGSFYLVAHEEFSSYRYFTAEQYLLLLKSFSPNSVLGEHQLREFYSEIYRVITEKDNRIRVCITVDVNIAKKAPYVCWRTDSRFRT